MLTEKAKSVAGVQQWPYKAVAKALEVIPRTLIQNCGANTIRTLTALRVSMLTSQLYLWDSCFKKCVASATLEYCVLFYGGNACFALIIA